jgi:hypothetical protein
MSTSYLLVVLLVMIGTTLLLVRLRLVRRRTVVRAPRWDGGVRRLLPEMTYTATGFSIQSGSFSRQSFDGLAEDRRESVAANFREAILRRREEEHVIDRFILNRLTTHAQAVAEQFGRIHHGQLTLYVIYGLLALPSGFLVLGAQNYNSRTIVLNTMAQPMPQLNRATIRAMSSAESPYTTYALRYPWCIRAKPLDTQSTASPMGCSTSRSSR